jgi:hypothetical protein
MTNEDVIDLFDQVKPGATVVVLAPGRSAWIGPIAGPRSLSKLAGGSPYNSKIAS